MEPVPETFTANMEVASDVLNDLCQRAVGATPGDLNNLFANGTPVMPDGFTRLVWLMGISGTTIGSGARVGVDESIDWRDRIVTAKYAPLTAAARSPGGADDYLFDVALTERCGYLGLGARDGSGNPLAGGSPPVPASGTSWAIELVADLWLYAEVSTGKLFLYNDGATITAPLLFVTGTAKTGRRP